MTLLASVDETLGRRVSMRALALLRLLVGPILLLHLRPLLQEATRPAAERIPFTDPYVSWWPVLPHGWYTALLVVGLVAAGATTVGVLTRAATVTAFVVVAYHLSLSTTHFRNNRAYLVVVLAALAVAPCGRELSVDAWMRARRGMAPLDTRAPGWPLWLLRFEASVVYGASGLSKLLDADWWGGTVTHLRVVRHLDQLQSSPLPAAVVDLLASRSFHTGAAKVVVLSELFIALGFWSRRTRYAAVWVAVAFHASIELSASVQVFSYLAVCVLVIWSVPSTRDRTLHLDVARHAPLHQVVRRLDWLARFRVVPGTGPVRLVDRNGHVCTGRVAVVRVLSRLPLTAWFALPLTLLRGGQQQGFDPVATSDALQHAQ